MRKLILILAGVIAVVFLGLIIAISLVDVSEYQQAALAQVEKATGRKAAIDGGLDLSLSLNPAIVAEQVRFANADWGSRPDMVTIKRVEVQVALLPLLSGEISVQRFVLVEPDLLLETNAEGRGNWEFGPATATTAAEQPEAGASAAAITPIDIGTVQIERLNLVFREHGKKDATSVTIDKLNLTSTTNNELDIDLAAALNRIPLLLSGHVGGLAQLLRNEPYPLDVTVTVGEATATLSGTVDKPLHGAGIALAATAQTTTLADFDTLAGTTLPDAGPLRIAVKISDTDSGYRLSDLDISLGDSRIEGSVTATLGGVAPFLDAQLVSSLLDLTPFQSETPPPKEKKDQLFTSGPLPLEGLHTANAKVSLDVATVKTRQADLKAFKAVLKLNDGKLQIKPLSATLAGGSLQGDLTLDASSKTARVAIRLNGKQIRLGRLRPLREKLSGGPTSLTIRLNGKGNSTRAIAAGASGKLLIHVGAAKLKREEKASAGFLASLGGLINPLSSEDNSKLTCAVINFPIKNGIADAKHGIGIETGQITVLGGGLINLKTERLDLAFEPHASGAIAGRIANLASVVKVGGTLAEPKVGADVGAMATTALKSVAGAAAAVTSAGTSALLGGALGGSSSAGSEPDPAPCQTALEGKPKRRQTAAKPSATEKQRPAKKESLLDAPRKLLKGLFGN